MTLPDPIHGGFANALGFGHRAAAPMSGPSRLSLQGGVDNPLDRFRRSGGLTSASFGHFPQTIRARVDKTLPPQGHGFDIEVQILSDELVLLPQGGRQNDPTPLRN